MSPFLAFAAALAWSSRILPAPLADDYALSSGPVRLGPRVPLFYQTLPSIPATERVAIIIDDMGRDLAAFETLRSLGWPMTLAVLPDQARSRETSLAAARAGFQILIHLPMEPLQYPSGVPDAGGVAVGMSPDEVVRVFDAAAEDVPGAVGFNNHMGSRATRSRSLMRSVLAHAKSRGLFYVDSKTTSRSVGLEVARELGVRAAGRRVFLDAEPSRRFVRRQLRALEVIAMLEGTAIGIGHPHPETLQVISELVPQMAARRIALVYASQAAR